MNEVGDGSIAKIEAALILSGPEDRAIRGDGLVAFEMKSGHSFSPIVCSTSSALSTAEHDALGVVRVKVSLSTPASASLDGH